MEGVPVGKGTFKGGGINEVPKKWAPLKGVRRVPPQGAPLKGVRPSGVYDDTYVLSSWVAEAFLVRVSFQVEVTLCHLDLACYRR